MENLLGTDSRNPPAKHRILQMYPEHGLARDPDLFTRTFDIAEIFPMAPLNVALVLVVGCTGLQLRRPILSAGVRTGHIVLYETPMWQAVGRRTPPVTNRGASDAIERYIRRAEFGALFNRVAVWRPSSHPVAELPGEALGVWGRRKCQRLRRILRERGASVEVRREAGPPQAVASWSRSW